MSEGAGESPSQTAIRRPASREPKPPPSGGAILRLGVTSWSDQLFFALYGGATLDDHPHEYDVPGATRFRF